jgi:effector-binding domain-containing protein
MARSKSKTAKPEPKLVRRRKQHYVAIRRQLSMREISKVLPPLMTEVFSWLGRKGIKPAGAPFWRYRVVDMPGNFEIDAAVPVARAVRGDKEVTADSLPAGRYATVLHVGHPRGLQQATAALLAWAEENGIQWQMDGERWAGRVEWYLTDPQTEPDMQEWHTELAFLTASAGR